MSSPAIPQPQSSPLLWIARVRGLFNGLGYVLTLTLIMSAGWMAATALDTSSTPATMPKSGFLLWTLGLIALAAVPGLTAVVVAVNLAPRAGLRRGVWLAGSGLLIALYCQWVVGHDLPRPLWLATLAEAALTTCLIVAVCAFHSNIQGAGDSLLRAQIECATLDAELKRAHLQLLRAQIEPHFLFNTLSAVRALARIDRAATVEMLDNLMRYFRAALPRLRQEEARLSEEMQLVEAYLGIYRVRMGARLSFEVTLPKNLADIRVPTMVLLTLVENALKHGVTPLVEGGCIRVSASRERAALLLKVADSGRGMSARLGHGVGLANVRQRLLMLYGDQAVLSLAHAEPRGVVATVAIPLR